MMIAPFALAIALGAAFLGLLGYVHHDGTAKGYRKHQIEIAEAVRAKNAELAHVNARADESIRRLTEERDAAVAAANAHPPFVGCVLPEAVRLDINRINRR